MIRFLQLQLLRLLLLLPLLLLLAAPSSTASSVAAYKVHLARLLFPSPALLPSLAASACAPFDVVLVLRCLLPLLSLCKKEASATQR